MLFVKFSCFCNCFSFTRFMVLGDFNLDGKLDIAVAAYNSDSIDFFPGDGTGSFGSVIQTAISGGGLLFVFLFLCVIVDLVNGITAGDWNSDGRLDLAVSLYDTNQIQSFLGQGNGMFVATGSALASAAQPWEIKPADFNNVSVLLCCIFLIQQKRMDIKILLLLAILETLFNTTEE